MGVLARGLLEGDGPFAAEWLFTDRLGGASAGEYAELNVGAFVGDDPRAVAANRARIASLVGADHLALVFQVHGREVARLSAPAEPPPHADAVITTVPGLPVGVQTADCVPILLADLEGGQVAAVHAGWRGVVAGVVDAALDALEARGTVLARVGPAICPACYEVSEDVRAEVCDVVADAYAVTRHGTPAVDVRAGVMAQLARRGISPELVGGCTFEDDTLYSYRRAAVTGRQAGVIVLRELA